MSKFPTLEFLKTAVNALKEMDADEERWNTTFQEMFNGSWCMPTYYDKPRSAIVKMVEQAFGDNSKDSTFSWWCFEKNYGTNDLEMYDKEHNLIPTKTVEDLYNYYTKEG